MITIGIVIVTCVISYAALNNQELFGKLAHYPYAESKYGQYYRFISGGFVHGSFPHLAINMYVLYQFGQMIENLFGSLFGSLGNLVYLFFYLSAIAVASVGTYMKHKDHQGFRSVGASGVTSALVFIYALFDPWAWFIFPPVPAIAFAILYVVYSTWASNNRNDNIDHLAHLYGGLYGVFFLFVTYPDSLRIFLDKFTAGLPF